MHSTVPVSYFSSPTRSRATTRPKSAFNPWMVASLVGVVALFVAFNVCASFGPKAVIADPPTASLKPLQPAAQTPDRAGGQTVSHPQDYPTGLYPAYLAARQNEGGVAYEVQTGETGLSATNPAQQLTASFGGGGATVEGLHLELNQVGYAGSTQSGRLVESSPAGAGNRVEYQHGAGLTEWYVNGPVGLEQGFTLNQAWPGSGQGQGQPLELELKLSGVKAAHLNTKSDALAVTLADGRQLNYGQLYVYDAHGQTFLASLSLMAGAEGEYRLTISVDGLSETATYPLTVDPLFTQAQVLSDTTNGAAYDYFGISVALSSDGNTALIGAYDKTVGGNTNQGAAYIFTRSGAGSSYSQAQVLSDTTNGAMNDQFGHSVALSSDGNTALVGAYFKTVGAAAHEGVVYVFKRSGAGSSYSQSQMFNDAISGAAGDYFGYSVALSSDGNTALIGAYAKKIGANNGQGAAYIFTRSGAGSSYAQFQTLIDPSGAVQDYFGTSVALSSDGNTALIGAFYKQVGSTTNQGAMYVFNRSGVGSSYAQSQLLSDTSGVTGHYFGQSVALSSDGNTALVGAPDKKVGANNVQGAAYIFTRSRAGVNYTQAQVLSDTTTGAASDHFGYSVALSSDGNTALIGAYTKQVGGNTNQGAAYIFTRSGVGSSYTQAQVLSDTTTGAASDRFGTSVALSSDGSTPLVGAYTKTIGTNTWQGEVYVFKPLTNSTTGLNSSLNPSPYNQNVTFTASVAPITATGTVTFKLDGSTSVTQTVAAGSASYVTNTLSVGQHSVVATYNGDSNVAPSTSPTLTQTVTAGSPAGITVLSGSGQSAVISTTFSAPLVAKVTDVGNNPVSGTTVTFTAPATGPSGTFQGSGMTYVGTTDASGTVTAPTFRANGQVGTYSVTATVGGSLAPASFNLTNTVGAVSAVTAVSGTPQSAVISTTFSAPLVAKVTDAGSNPVSGATVTFTTPASGPSGTFLGGSTSYVGSTDASGRVTTTLFTANALTGSYTVTATVGGVAIPATFSLTNLSSCDPLLVTSTLDNGNCGTLRQAVIAASTGPTKTVTISLTAGSVISLTSGITLTNGIVITTTAGNAPGGGPGIIIQGSGPASGDGLTLVGTNTLSNLWVRGFSGRQIVAPPGSHGLLKGVRASKS